MNTYRFRGSGSQDSRSIACRGNRQCLYCTNKDDEAENEVYDGK